MVKLAVLLCFSFTLELGFFHYDFKCSYHGLLISKLDYLVGALTNDDTLMY